MGIFSISVALHLLKNGDKQDDESTGSNKLRQAALLLLTDMYPAAIPVIRAKCLEWCRMPSLALMLTLKSKDLVPFMSGLLLGSDSHVRSWISFFVRNGQKKPRVNPALTEFRKALLAMLKDLAFEMKKEDNVKVDVVVRATSLLRLYTALRGIAGMK